MDFAAVIVVTLHPTPQITTRSAVRAKVDGDFDCGSSIAPYALGGVIPGQFK